MSIEKSIVKNNKFTDKYVLCLNSILSNTRYLCYIATH